MKTDLDLAIIGGGILGVCTAWYARKQYPAWNIGLFDQSKIGGGATFYSASLDLPYGHTPLRYQLAKRSRELFLTLRKELPDLPIRDLPFYGIVHREHAQLVMDQLTDPTVAVSPEIIPILHHKFPLLLLPKDATIISGGTASQGITNEVVNVLAKNLAGSPDTVILENTKVISVISREEIFDLQTSGREIFHSKRVVQATGPWCNEILGTGLLPPQNIRVKKIVAFHIYEQPKPTDPVFYFFDDDAFLMPKYKAGYWLFSFKCDHWDVSPDISTLSIDEADIQKARGILYKYYPQFALLCKEGRVFCDAYTANGDPVTGQAGPYPNYVFAGAGAGSGYRLAPAIAEAALKHFIS